MPWGKVVKRHGVELTFLQSIRPKHNGISEGLNRGSPDIN